jgi:hypothetical protein
MSAGGVCHFFAGRPSAMACNSRVRIFRQRMMAEALTLSILDAALAGARGYGSPHCL